MNRKHQKAYDTKKSKVYKNHILILTKFQYHGEVLEGPIKINATFYRPIPKSISQVKKDKMMSGEIMPCVKPDLDNYFKAVTDAINGVVFRDDKQIVEVHMFKKYSDSPRTELEIEEVIGE